MICLYLDYTQSTAHALEDLFGSLLKQLLQLKESNPVSAGLRQLYHNAKHRYDGRRDCDDFQALLRDELGACERVYLVVDALDQCRSATRRSLQEELCKLRPDKLSMIITSRVIEIEADDEVVTCSHCERPEIKIHYDCSICKFELCQRCIEKKVHCRDKSHKLLEPYDRVQIDIGMCDEDLKEYVMWTLRREAAIGTSDHRDERRHPRHSGRLQGDPGLLREICNAIVQRAEGSALLAKLYLDSIEVKECLNQKDVATLLRSFPKKVDQVYEKEMRRIVDQDQDDKDTAIAALSWVSCARRHLSFLELQHSLATEAGTTDFDVKNIYRKDNLLWVTGGLITIESDEAPVRLVHTTMQEYLEETGSKWFPNAEANMAHICLTYLNFDALSQPREEVESFDTKKYPFIAYASQHWGDHVREAGLDLHTDIRDLALRIVNEPLRLAAYMQAAWATDAPDYDGWDVCEGVTSLHVFAWFGLSSMIPNLIQKGLDVDVREPTYRQTPLMYACRRGHVQVVRQLLDFGAWVNKVSARGRTAMFEAVAQNNEDVVKLLLAKHELLTRPKLDLKAVNPRDSGQTAFMLAARSGHLGIVEILLEHSDIDVNQQDANGSTALSLAAAKPLGFIVKQLLLKKRGIIDVNLVDHTGGRSALIRAAGVNEHETVRLLLESGANPHLKDFQDGGTAIMHAIDYGHTSVIETMLQYGVNDQGKDDNGRGLVHSASVSGLPDMIKLFVEKGLDQNLQDKNGFTPLHDASRNSKPEVIETLLDLSADPTIKDSFGRTPLVVAWQYGETEIMNVLQRKGKTEQEDSDLISKEENLPIWSLVRLGRSVLIADVIAANKSNLTAVEPGIDDTALHWAIRQNQVDILSMLLETAEMDPNATNRHQRTPLHLTALCGSCDATSVLLDHGAKLEAMDRWGATPLSVAYSNKNFPVAILLIEAGACIDTRIFNVQKMFFAAVELKSTKAAEILIAKGASIVTKNADGRWAMQLAKEAEDEQMITYLKSVKSLPYRADEETYLADEETYRANEKTYRANEKTYRADEEKSEEGGGVVTPTPSPSPEESPYITSWADFFMS